MATTTSPERHGRWRLAERRLAEWTEFDAFHAEPLLPAAYAQPVSSGRAGFERCGRALRAATGRLHQEVERVLPVPPNRRALDVAHGASLLAPAPMRRRPRPHRAPDLGRGHTSVRTPIRASRVTSAAKSISDNPSLSAGRGGTVK